MKKKIIRPTSAVLSAAILLLSGCNAPPAETITTSATAGSTQTSAETEASPAVESVPLNIIDDNCRNYYEIFVRSFYDSDGDGIGDLCGVTEKLDYIRDMGFNGIWLMPINPSTTYHKYDVTDYYGIDPEYGTLDDFMALLDGCEKRGIRLITDLVLNHTSAKHPWFTGAAEYIRSLGDKEIDLSECKYAGYYNFTNEKNPGKGWCALPNADGWYYECQFWDQMPDLNLDNADVRAEIENMAKYWLDMGVDGFRLDAAKEYFSGNKEKNTEVLKWFCDYVKSVNPDAYIVGEVWDSENAISGYYKSGIDSLFDFPLSQSGGDIIRIARGMLKSVTPADIMLRAAESYGKSNPDFIEAAFVSNHDTGRIANACMNDETQMKLAAGILLTTNGSPFVYYGEEIGLNSYGDKDENKRLPMNWSVTDAAGITKKPENADEVAQKHAPADEQLSDPLSILNYYKKALRLRNENPEIARGTVEKLDTGNENVSAVRKNWNGSVIEIYYNLTDSAQTVSTGLAIAGYLAVDESVPEISDGKLTLPPYTIVICK